MPSIKLRPTVKQGIPSVEVTEWP